MTDRCFTPEEFGPLLALPANDPRRAHLDACPACRALAHAWREFQAPPPEALPDGLDEADAQLAARLQDALGLPPPLCGVPGGGGRRAPARPGARRALLAAAAALAACAVLFVARDLSVLRGPRLPDRPGVERGGADNVGDPRVLPQNDGWRLTWRRPPGTDAAVVVLFDARLRELTRRAAGADSSLAIGGDNTAREAVWAQVLFLAEGDTVAHSPIVGPQ